MKTINLKSMLDNIGDLEKIAQALTPAEAARQIEEESTPGGTAAKAGGKGALIGAIAGGLHGSMKPGSGKMKALKGVYHAGAAGMWLGGAAAAGGYAKRKLFKRSEESKQRALEKLMEGRTTIIIAHRLSTIMKADKIVVMKNGKIVQIGKHRQLIKKEGPYKKLWNLQKGGYIK